MNLRVFIVLVCTFLVSGCELVTNAVGVPGAMLDQFVSGKSLSKSNRTLSRQNADLQRNNRDLESQVQNLENQNSTMRSRMRTYTQIIEALERNPCFHVDRRSGDQVLIQPIIDEDCAR